MYIFNAAQIREWDAFTIAREPIASLDLMDRAASALTDAFFQRYPQDMPVRVVAGKGNNGGDGVAMALRLHWLGYDTKIYVADFGQKATPEFEAQWARVRSVSSIDAHTLNAGQAPDLPDNAIVIDALFGVGLNRPLEGPWALLVERLNAARRHTVAIDVPSGLNPDHCLQGPVVRAAHTMSIQAPKLAFFMPENEKWIGEWEILNIGLHADYPGVSPWRCLNAPEVAAMLPARPRFAHKGVFGHVLMVAGSYGKAGAARLSAEACLRSGAGLVTVRCPEACVTPLQAGIPEAMCDPDPGAHALSAPFDGDWSRYKAVGVGPGIGQTPQTAEVLCDLIERCPLPIVFDADALNILAARPALLDRIPRGSILTPHPGEFARLFGEAQHSLARFEIALEQAARLSAYIVLKGAYTLVACPDGSAYFNTTGNAGMATAGSGDVLTGLVAGLLAQGLRAREACLAGVFIHGRAGDLAKAQLGEQGMLAGDIARAIGHAMAF
ncbi:MAG: NAD(P)H-hydrate dehydratase [Saprospiraceae bacterium]